MTAEARLAARELQAVTTMALGRQAFWLSRVRSNVSVSDSTRMSSSSRSLVRNRVWLAHNTMLVRLLGCAYFIVSDTGSAEQMREEGRNLTLMIQADMIAYREPGEPPQLGLPEMYVL
jgi:hypothetical protein